MRLGCLPLIAAFVLILILPWLFIGVLEGALVKLQIGPQTAAGVVFGILIGSMINVPVRRIERREPMPVDPWAMFGLGGYWPARQVRMVTVIAVNVGGCVIPTALAAYEIWSLLHWGAAAFAGLAAAVLLNIGVCYRLARPVRGVGILMPGLVPPLVAALAALLLAPQHATPVAFVAGTLGPLVGADLLHLREVGRMQTGILSIGGAGTFDGIVLSGIVALYLS